MLIVESDTFDGFCGINIFNCFQEGADKTIDLKIKGDATLGTGMAMAAFINTPLCRKIYSKLKEIGEIMYQSPVRTNLNTGNLFFFVVYNIKRS